MSSNVNHAVCGAVLALSVAACHAGPTDVEEKSVAKVRLQLDIARNRVWLLTSEGVALYDAAAPDKLVRVPVPGWLYAGEPYGCLPDLALGPKGEAVISSDVVPVLWRVDPETLAVTQHEPRLDADTDKDVGFRVLSYSPAQGAFFAVSSPHGTVWRIDPALQNANKMARQIPREKGCGARMSD